MLQPRRGGRLAPARVVHCNRAAEVRAAWQALFEAKAVPTTKETRALLAKTHAMLREDLAKGVLACCGP